MKLKLRTEGLKRGVLHVLVRKPYNIINLITNVENNMFSTYTSYFLFTWDS